MKSGPEHGRVKVRLGSREAARPLGAIVTTLPPPFSLRECGAAAVDAQTQFRPFPHLRIAVPGNPVESFLNLTFRNATECECDSESNIGTLIDCCAQQSSAGLTRP